MVPPDPTSDKERVMPVRAPCRLCGASMDEEHHMALDCGPCREKKARGKVEVPEEKKGPQGITLSQDEYDQLLAKASDDAVCGLCGTSHEQA